MMMKRLYKTMVAAATAGLLWAGAAQALTVDLISNGDFEGGSLSGWSTTANSRGETFVVNDGSTNPPGPLGATAPISGSYDTYFSPRRAGVGSLTQYFTVPDQVLSATFNFTQRVGLWGFYDIPDQQFRVSVVDQIGNVVSRIYSTAASGLQLDNGTITPLSFDLTALMQANQGQTLGVQFELEARRWSMNVSLDDIAMMVETPATVPLPPTVWMMLAGLGLFGYLGWKRRREEAGGAS